MQTGLEPLAIKRKGGKPVQPVPHRWVSHCFGSRVPGGGERTAGAGPDEERGSPSGCVWSCLGPSLVLFGAVVLRPGPRVDTQSLSSLGGPRVCSAQFSGVPTLIWGPTLRTTGLVAKHLWEVFPVL